MARGSRGHADGMAGGRVEGTWALVGGGFWGRGEAVKWACPHGRHRGDPSQSGGVTGVKRSVVSGRSQRKRENRAQGRCGWGGVRRHRTGAEPQKTRGPLDGPGPTQRERGCLRGWAEGSVTHHTSDGPRLAGRRPQGRGRGAGSPVKGSRPAWGGGTGSPG